MTFWVNKLEVGLLFLFTPLVNDNSVAAVAEVQASVCEEGEGQCVDGVRSVWDILRGSRSDTGFNLADPHPATG